MSRPSRREMQELAEDREKCAARCDRNAKSGREEAAALREGRIPGEDW